MRLAPEPASIESWPAFARRLSRSRQLTPTMSPDLRLASESLGNGYSRPRVSFCKFTGRKTPDDHLFLCQVARVFAAAPIEVDAHGGRARTARANQIWGKSKLLSQFINQACTFSQKIVINQSVTVPQQQHWTVWVRQHCCPVRFVGDNADKSFLGRRFWGV